jgi:phosphoribosylanthranilate isomerase
MGVRVKICGLRNEEDVRLAVAGGADFLGAVLDAGPRQVTAAELGTIVRAAGSVPVFVVAVHADADTLARIAQAAGVAGIQLHGRQSAADAHRLRGEGFMVWRTARLGAESDMTMEAAADGADAVLVEPAVPYHHGGTGVALSLAMSQQAREALGDCPMVLAGGLRPETVAATIRSVRPFAVDVSSGVELRPGHKDPQRMTQFLTAVRNA